MPCNVIVYENDGGGATVTAVDPTVSIGSIDNADICGVAAEVKATLKKIIEGL